MIKMRQNLYHIKVCKTNFQVINQLEQYIMYKPSKLIKMQNCSFWTNYLIKAHKLKRKKNIKLLMNYHKYILKIITFNQIKQLANKCRLKIKMINNQFNNLKKYEIIRVILIFRKKIKCIQWREIFLMIYLIYDNHNVIIKFYIY